MFCVGFVILLLMMFFVIKLVIVKLLFFDNKFEIVVVVDFLEGVSLEVIECILFGVVDIVW